MTENTLQDLIEAGLDAINIDIKGNREAVKKFCGSDVDKIWRNAKIAKKNGVHVEITTLLIAGINSDEEIIRNIAKRIGNDLGNDTPFHITRFFPHFKSGEHGLSKPTSRNLLEQALLTAKSTGLEFVYIGNLPHTKYENTTCPDCSKLIIKRDGFNMEILNATENGNCMNCGRSIFVN